jgi:hypothetical protein
VDPEDVLTLTALTGRSLRTVDGQARGVVRDLTVRLGDGDLRVRRVLVVRRGRQQLLPWSTVTLDGARLTLLAGADVTEPSDGSRLEAEELDLDTDEVLLGRDVLDCQIVDLSGRRLTRASDVVLSRTLSGGLALVGVEVGVRAVLRRLGFGRLTGRLRRSVVPVDQLHLSSARGHQVQLGVSTSAVHRLDAEGLSHLLTRLDVTKATDVIGSVGPVRAAEALLKTHPVVGRRLMSALPERESTRLREHLPHGSAVTHPQLHEHVASHPRRVRRLVGWRTHNPPEVSE